MATLSKALSDLLKERKRLATQVLRLDDALAILRRLRNGGHGSRAARTRGGRRRLSAAARKRIAQAQKKRWAKWKAKRGKKR